MNEFKVGLLALAAIAAVVVMSIKITSNQSGFGDYITYRTILNDAAGIFEKTPIKVAGINAGRIVSIELVGNQALVTFEILKDIKVTKSSVLRIRTVGFLGDKYLDIYLGEDEGKRLKEGELIPSQAGGGMEDIAKDASEVVADLKAIVKSVRKSIAPEGKEAPLEDILANVKSATANLREMSETLRGVVGRNEENMDKFMANIREISDGLRTDLKKVGPVSSKADNVMSDLKVMVGDVRQGKGTVGKLLRDEQVIDEVTETLAGVKKIVNKVNSLRTELSLFTGTNTIESGRSEMSLDIYPSPERFYRLGLTTSKFGPKEEKTITTTTGGTTTVQERREVDKNTYRFNVQIGRRIHDFSFRVGLIESTGGLGVDYHWEKMQTIFTFEAFDYDEDLGPNLRILSEVHLWNVFYGRVGAEDIISKNGDQSFTLSAGLKFTDEDLKGLIGFFF